MCPLRNSRFCSSATFSPIISRVIVSLCRSRVRHYLNNVQKTLGEIVFSSPFTGFRRDASCNTFSRVGKWKRFHVYKLSEVIPGHRYISPWIFDRKLAHFETEEFVTFLFFFAPFFFFPSCNFDDVQKLRQLRESACTSLWKSYPKNSSYIYASLPKQKLDKVYLYLLKIPHICLANVTHVSIPSLLLAQWFTAIQKSILDLYTGENGFFCVCVAIWVVFIPRDQMIIIFQESVSTSEVYANQLSKKKKK